MKKFILIFLIPIAIFSQTVIDGDTFYYNGNKYRLAYIDAPEISQPIVGELSKKHLEKIIDLSNMKVISTDKYGRYIVVLGNINYRMVKEGYAFVYRFYCNKESYIKSETLARKNKLGIHKYNFKNPSDWRKIKK